MNAPLKDSGVEWLGRIPAHWETRRLALCFREVARPGSEDLPVLSISIHDGISDDELDADERKRKVTHIEDRSKYKRVLPGDLAYNMMRAWQGGLGAVSVEGQVSPAYVVAEPKVPLNTRYIELLLRTPMAIEEMRRFSRGIADFRSRLYWEQFRDLRVCLPPLEEQEAILRDVSRDTERIDALISKKTRFIDRLREKRGALIAHAVTKGLDQSAPKKDSGVAWLGKVPAHWKVGATRRFFGFSPSKKEAFRREVPAEVSFLPMEAIGEDGSLDLSRTRPVREVVNGYSYFADGDVVIAKITPCFENGKGAAIAGLTAGIGFGTTELIVLRPMQSVTQRFAWWLFSAASFRKYAEGNMEGSAGQKRVPDEWLKALKIAMPPQCEQREISSYLEFSCGRIDALICKTERSIELLREHRSSLISATVTGQLGSREAA